jgi:N-methylhydantoinase A
VGNAIIERKGARTALVTTAGFKDVLTFGREFRYDIYDSHLVLPPAIVKRRERFEITERVSADGRVAVALDRVEAEKVAKAIARGGYQSVAVCFLHSYRNDLHEKTMASTLRAACPEVHVSLSSEILPQLGEFERTCITTLNAYVQPVLKVYLEALRRRLESAGVSGRLFCMASNGGLLTAEIAGRYPIRLAESGPVAGALGAAHYSALIGQGDLLSFDMGGTTAKACVIVGSRPSIMNEFEIARVRRQAPGSGLPIRLPAVDMREVGAGGGSIARVNDFGLLTVGPDSAGALPGPACYGRGGKAATVTDASVVLGYIDPDYFLGGEMQLDVGAARRAVREVGAAARLTEVRAAAGIHEMVSQDMASALQTHAIEKGIDYRKFTLLAFGGAGPLHAHRIASLLGIGRVVFPANAGAFSAFGMLTAPLRFEVVRTLRTALHDLTGSMFSRVFSQLESDLLGVFELAGLAPRTVTLQRSIDVRYAGQGVELEVEVPNTISGAPDIAHRFAKLYAERYGWVLRGGMLEMVNWRCTAVGPVPEIAKGGRQRRLASARTTGHRPAYVPEARDYRDCPVYDRYALVQGQQIKGPAIIEERESTAWIGSDATAFLDSQGSIVMEVRTR